MPEPLEALARPIEEQPIKRAAARLSVGFLVGSDAVEQIAWDERTPIRLHANNDMWRLLDLSVFRSRRFHIAPGYFSQPRHWKIHECRVLINRINDPDRNPATLQVARALLAEYSGPVLNRPEYMGETRRDRGARKLSGIDNVIVPTTVRFRGLSADRIRRKVERAALSFPAIVRISGSHTGDILELCGGINGLLALSFDDERHYIATSFVPYGSPDGLFRKFRVFFIGQQMVLRHMLVSDQWNVHAKERMRFMLARDDVLAEEQEYFESFERFPATIREALSAIRARIELDYFGLDFAVTGDAKLVVFEANATMNFFPFSDDPRLDYVKSCIAPAKAAVTKLLLDAVSISNSR